MPVLRKSIAAMAGLALSAPVEAQTLDYTEPASIDRAVESFTGVATGSDGGATNEFDRRVRLARCDAPLDIQWHTPRKDLLRVECRAPKSWQVFVPVTRKEPMALKSAPNVKRGQIVSLEISATSFSVTQQGEALETGSTGDWIKVRPVGSTASVLGKIEPSGNISVPLR